MRDVDHADAALAQPAQHGEHALHLVGGQAGCGFVEHQHVSLDGKCTRDGDERFLGAAQMLHPGGGVEVTADKRQGFCCAALRLAPVDESGAARIALRQPDVFGHRHPFDQPQVLVDEGHLLLLVGPRRGVHIRSAPEQDLALVGRVDAGQRLDEGGLAGTIFAKQCKDFAGIEVKAHRAQGGGAAEALGDVLEAEKTCPQVPFPSLHFLRSRGVGAI